MSLKQRLPGCCWCVTLTINPFHRELQAQVVLGIHHPVVTGRGDVEHQPPFLCSPDRSGVKQEQIWIPETKKQNSQLARISTGVPTGTHRHPLGSAQGWAVSDGWSWADVCSPLITPRWSFSSLLFTKGRMDWSRVEVVWGYFAVTANLELLMHPQKTLARHRSTELLFAYANLVIGQTVLLISLSTHDFLTFMRNCSIGASQLEHWCAYISICNRFFLNLLVWDYR